MKLTEKPESVSEIAERTGIDELELSKKLEELAQNGLIFRLREGDKCLYHVFQFVVGLYEFQINRMDREFCEIFEEYMPYFAMSMASVSTPQMRTVPVESALGEISRVAPYDRIREMVKKEDIISVCRCICRKELKLMGRTCPHPEEVCLMFGKFARFYIENNFARQISSDEAIKILNLAEENGIVLRPTNSQKLDAICCCCAHACIRNIAALPNQGDIIGSSFKSVIDPALCTGCGECIEICHMEAVKDDNGIAVADENRCIGCGLCVDRCPVEAISMIKQEGKKEVPPENFDKLLVQIAAERGI